ncbi:hypothetical protein D3C71_1477080 [compost metagenome]
MELPLFVTKRMGGSCAQVGKPGVKESGTPEDVPRTAAITQNYGRKKTPAIRMGALLRLTLGLPSPVTELAATAEGYRAGLSPATLAVGGIVWISPFYRSPSAGVVNFKLTTDPSARMPSATPWNSCRCFANGLLPLTRLQWSQFDFIKTTPTKKPQTHKA